MKVIDKNSGEVVAVVGDGWQWLAENELAPEGFNVEMEDRERRVRMRDDIARRAGDFESLLGTTADASLIALVELARLVASLSSAASLAEVRAAAASFAPTSEQLLADIAGGSVELPYEVKGLEAALADIKQRATAVSQAMAENSSGGES